MKHYLIATLVLTGFTLHAFDSSLEFRHRESEGVGYNQGYSTVEFIGNQNWKRFELLLDVRGHIFNNGKLAGNSGFGVRVPFKDQRYLVGANGFYDIRQTSELTAQQVGMGVEFLSKRADLRANGYIPFSKKSDFEQKLFSTFSGNTVYVKQHAETTLPCVDLELGVPIKSLFYLAAGTYYLFEKDIHGMHAGGAWGGKFRAVVDVTNFLSLSAIVTHDSIFNTRVQGYISFNIALEKWKNKKDSNTKLKKRSRNLRNVPITRNEIIPIQKKHRTAPLSEVDTTGNLSSIIFVNNAFGGIGKGTFEEPFTSLKEAELSSKPGDIIYVLPGDGTAHNMDEGIVLKENQTLTSSNAPLEMNALVIPPLTPDQKPVITNIHKDEPVITQAEGSHSENAFTIIDPSDYIFGDWEPSSYDDDITPDLLGGDPSGAVATGFGDDDSGSDLDDIVHVTGSELNEDSDDVYSVSSDDSFEHVDISDANDAPSSDGGGWFNWW